MISGRASGHQGSNGDDSDQGSQGLNRNWAVLMDKFKAVEDEVDAILEEDAKKSAKIRRLMEENVLLEQSLMIVENKALQPRPMPRPNPLCLFSAEIWEMIIANMDSSSDLEMLCLAFPTLKPLVKRNKKTIFMFENVIPLVSTHLDLKDINNCRRVCGKWDRDVRALLQDFNSPELVADSLSDHEVISRTSIPAHKPHSQLKAAYDFFNTEKIQNFLTKMADHPGNPFIGRFLRLTVDDRTNLRSFWRSTSELLEKFGEHVWNLELVCSRRCYSEITFYKALHATLNHLHNLKYLAITCSNRPKLNKSAISRVIGSSALPGLPHLQSLELTLHGKTGMITSLTPYFSPQIRQLRLFSDTLGNVNLKDEWSRSLINLEHIEVELKLAEDFSRLLKLPSQKLKKLCLCTALIGDPKLVSLTSGQVIGLLENFPRLECLNLGDFHVTPCSSVEFGGRNAKQLSLDITIRSLQEDLDFLLRLPYLKNLYIRIGVRHGTDAIQLNVDGMEEHFVLKIRKNLYTNTILHSNIWTLLPSLEILELDTMRGKEKYTRAMLDNRV